MKLPTVVLCGTRGFKYILIAAYSERAEPLYFVRGHYTDKYHVDILKKFEEEVRMCGDDCIPLGFRIECLGGGFVSKDEENKIIRVYSESHQFGPEPDREVTVRLIAEQYPEYEILRS